MNSIIQPVSSNFGLTSQDTEIVRSASTLSQSFLRVMISSGSKRNPRGLKGSPVRNGFLIGNR